MAKLTGTANDDTIIGAFAINDTLSGGAGNDLIFGYGDAKGGIGLPVPALDPAGGGAKDNDLLNGGLGADTIRAGNGNDTLLGGDGIDQLFGDFGADRLDGGAGADSMDGGDGDDIYIVDNVGDKAAEAFADALSGTDLVLSSVSHALGFGIDNLTLTGKSADTGTGNDLSNLITGNAAVNMLNGGEGNDTLNGMGGADSMAGGLDNDLYVIDNAGDTVTELGGEGIDTIRWMLSKNLDLAAFAEIENATLLGKAAVSLTGTAGNNALGGNAGANKIDGAGGADTMAGGGGNDIYITDGGDIIAEFANGGVDQVLSSASITLSDNFEHLVLTGVADISGDGNGLKNRITGNSGDNNLDGGRDGGDTMIGGDGDDTYVVDPGDVIAETLAAPAGGNDTVHWTGLTAYGLGANVESLLLFSAVVGIGNSLDNAITGNGTNNILDGRAGADTMIGDKGDDIYFVDNLADQIVESPLSATDGINDQVRSSVALTAGFDAVEDYIFTGSKAVNFTGNLLFNRITGTAGADTLTGDSGPMGGNDTLDGGAGADSLVGLDGDDVYIVDNAKDTVSEVGGSGSDTVRSPSSFNLEENGTTIVGDLERLELTGKAAINGTGNLLHNSLIGNAAANKLFGLTGSDSLDGGGGNDTLNGGQEDLGFDTLRGGAGNDLYLVDAFDQTIEDLAGAAGGIDTVISTGGYALGANLENLTVLLGVTAIGNGLANIITGNDGANSLDGKAGADKMSGGGGDDSYAVDNAGDKIFELAGGGTDTVNSDISYVLSVELENLTLTGGSSKGTGSARDNIILGGAGNDTLDGKGGADNLDGKGGDDTLIVDNLADVTSDSVDGIDLVLSSVNHTISAGIDNLTLIGKAAINGTGNELGNLITGNSGANSLDGGIGNDTLIGAAGNDTLTGGLDDDVFLYLAGAAGKDTITDFLTGAGDAIDISDMLTGYVDGVSDIHDFVQLAYIGGDAVLRVDANGLAGGSKFTDLVVLTAPINQSVDQLVAGGSLVLT